MKRYPSLRRFLAGICTFAIFVAAWFFVTSSARSPNPIASHTDRNRQSDQGTWPMFGGSLSRNMVNTFEKNIPTEWNVEEGSQKNIKWVSDLGSKAYGGPIVASGKVFVGTNNQKPRNPKIKGDKGIVMCFDENTGKFLWQSVHDKLPAGRVNDWPEEGICSSPFVEGNRLYFVSNRCELICADTEGFLDGKNDGVQDEKYKDKIDADIIWRLDMIKALDVFPHNLATSSPLVVGDTIFLVTSNGVDEGHINIPQPKAPSFIAVNKHDGKVLWMDKSPTAKLVEEEGTGKKEVLIKQLLDKGLILMHGQWSSPVYAVTNGKPQVIFPGGDGWLYSFEPQTGKLIWKFDCNPKSSVYRLGGRGTRSDFIATPVVHENRVYIGVGQDPEHKEGVGHLWCIDITKEGDVSPVNDNFDPKAPENKNSALVWHYGGLADTENAQKIGRNYYFGRTMSSCAIHDGLLYVAELAGYIHCLDARTGQKYWDHDMGAATWSSPYWVDDKVYMGNDNGQLLIFAHGKEKKILAEIDMQGKVRATPVAANGVLYIMTENKLYAISNR
jgi:outer membrane protein assembly factor BamB